VLVLKGELIDMFKRIILLSISALAMNAFSHTEKSNTLAISQVTKHRMHSVSHTNSGANNMFMMYVSGLQEGCNSLYLYADKDPYLFSAVISGLASQKATSIQVIYHVDDSTRGPWGDASSCRLTSFSVDF